MLPTKFRFIWQAVPGEKIFVRNWPIRKKNCLWRPYLWTDRDEMSNLYRGPSINASYQVSIHLAMQQLEYDQDNQMHDNFTENF
jgi:hypothetical protein